MVVSREKFDFRLDLAVKAGTGKACTIDNMQTKIESVNMIPARYFLCRQFERILSDKYKRNREVLEGH